MSQDGWTDRTRWMDGWMQQTFEAWEKQMTRARRTKEGSDGAGEGNQREDLWRGKQELERRASLMALGRWSGGVLGWMPVLTAFCHTSLFLRTLISVCAIFYSWTPFESAVLHLGNKWKAVAMSRYWGPQREVRAQVEVWREKGKKLEGD